jgi:drug/metabolite transporter (DMT)-like permease
MASLDTDQARVIVGRQEPGGVQREPQVAGWRKHAMTTTMICILMSTACGVSGQLILKKAMMGIGVLTPTANAVPMIVMKIATSPLVIAGMSFYVLGSFFWLIALSRVQLSFAYPFASLSYILIFAATYYFYGETINAWRLAGMVVICFGVLLISRS